MFQAIQFVDVGVGVAWLLEQQVVEIAVTIVVERVRSYRHAYSLAGLPLRGTILVDKYQIRNPVV